MRSLTEYGHGHIWAILLNMESDHIWSVMSLLFPDALLTCLGVPGHVSKVLVTAWVARDAAGASLAIIDSGKLSY